MAYKALNTLRIFPVVVDKIIIEYAHHHVQFRTRRYWINGAFTAVIWQIEKAYQYRYDKKNLDYIFNTKNNHKRIKTHKDTLLIRNTYKITNTKYWEYAV